MDEDTDFIKLPLDERCTHKLWKARVHGYEEATKLFRRIDDERSSEWNKFASLLKKFVGDSNVAAQEKGLEATLAYVENAFIAAKTVGDVMPIIITKCIGATKAKIKDLAIQISLMYIEIEKQDIVLEELLKGTEQKNPKISAACVATIAQTLREFGYKVIDVKSLLKKLPVLLEDRDKNVREEAKTLAVELFKWIGPVLKTHLASLKPIQLQELETEFDKVKDEKPSIQRYLRSQQAKQSKMAEAAREEDDGEDVPDNDEGAEIDPLELVEAVDVLSKLPSDFYEKLEAQKWKDRKEVLDTLEQLLTNAPKLENGDYGDLVRALKKIVTKDSNVMVVGTGCKCMAMLAKGLKKKFQPFAAHCMPSMLEKFKEKKQNVVLPLRDAVDAIYDSTTLEAVQEDIIASMESKNPTVKAETVAFLTRCFTKCNSLMLNKKLLKIFTTALLKTLNESDPLVRDNSAEAIGTAWKVVGEKVISPFLTEVDNIKIAKIKEASEKAVITAKPPKVVKKAPAAEPVAEKPKAGSVNPKPVTRKPVNKTATFVKKSSSSTSLNQKRVGSGNAATKQKASVNGVEDDASNENGERYPDMQDLVARVDISSKITPALVDELTHRDWKVRSEAVNKLQTIVTEAKFITNNLGEAVPAITERLTDSNGRLAASSIALCESIAVAMGPSCKTYVREFFPSMLQGLGDSKSYLRSAAIKCINTWANTTGYREYFECEMIATALKSGSPTLRAELWSWLAEGLPETKSIPKDELMACLPYLYNNLEDRNSEVRKNANEAVQGFMIHLSYQTMFHACEKLKPVSVNNIKGVLDKTRANLPDIPVTTSRPSSKQSASAPSSAGSQTLTKSKSATMVKPKSQTKMPVISKKKTEEDVDSTPLLKVNNLKMQRNIDENKLKILKWNFSAPREEFVEQLKDQMNTAGVNKTLITNMFHQNFKFHLKAIDALSEDISNTAALTSNLDLVLKWLTLRFFDTNPSVILRGLEYLNVVFHALAEEGYHMMESEAASFLPYLVLKTGDPKDVVRNLVRDIFDAIGSVYPISKLFNFIMDGVKSKNARQRTGCLEQLSRLIENYGLSVCQPTPAAALKEIAKQISDRDNSVRNAALNCVVAAYFITGDKVRQMIGQISDKDMSLLDERIKRASKTRPPVATVKPTVCSPIKRPTQHESSPPQINNNTYNCNSEDEISADDDVYVEEEVEAIPQRPSSVNVSPLNESQNSKRKHFGLDLHVMEAIESASIVLPKPNLIDYDKKYLEEKVIPITRSTPVTPNYAYSTQTIVKNRTASPSPPKQNSLESWITVMGSSTDLTEITDAIKRAESILQSEDKRKELIGMENQLVTQVVKLLTFFSNLNPDANVESCYRQVLSLLMKFFSFPNHSMRVTDVQLQQLLKLLITSLVEKRQENSGNWMALQKIINNLVLKVLERSEHAMVISALLQMLYESVASSNTDQYYQELIMKCIWKTIKYIPDWDADLDYNKVLCEIYRFMNDFPNSWWKRQPNDTPMRTYKTMVHAIVTARGADVLTTVNFIPGFSQQSELYHYINKLLKHMKLEEKTDEVPDKTKYHMPRVQHEELAQILKKIGNKEETEQGLRMLYEFKKNYPEININQFLSKTSPYFQSYVSEGLKKVQAEKEGEMLRDNLINIGDRYVSRMNTSDSNDNPLLEAEDGSGESLESDAQRYQQKLKMLQMRAGWDQHKKLGTTPAVNNEQPSNLIPTLRITSPPQKHFRDNDGDGSSLEQIRRKLSQLKGGN